MISNPCLPIWLLQSEVDQSPTKFVFSNAQYILILPALRRFLSNMSDLSLINTVQPSVESQPEIPSQSFLKYGQPLDFLHWSLAALHAKERFDKIDYQYSLIRLQSWPNLTKLSSSFTPELARLCALLSRKPTTASLIPNVLDIDYDKTFLLIETL